MTERDARIFWLRAAIADISARMRGPLSNVERALLHADRKEFREELQKLESEAA